MNLDDFLSTIFYSFLICYYFSLIFDGLHEIFPHERRGIKVDFKQHD